jgi:hypothetical protein
MLGRKTSCPRQLRPITTTGVLVQRCWGHGASLRDCASGGGRRSSSATAPHVSLDVGEQERAETDREIVRSGVRKT